MREELRSQLPKGLRAFTHYNRYKKSIMLENDPLGGRAVIKLLPLCIHINHPDLPGYVADKSCPCGVKTMEWPSDVREILESQVSGRVGTSDMQNYIPRHREIEGIFTIGSVGSVGQTRKSDYDIWVVVDRDAIGKARIALLQTKLKRLEKWMATQFLVELHFFLMDVQDILTNNFGVVSQEGAGSALKFVLKEEFYRTMTLIEGRIPLWWIIPPGLGPQAYELAFEVMHRVDGLALDDFIDLGNIVSVPEQEFLGTALWQMHKALDDPLKSMLKMALMATYLDVNEERVLLCDRLKELVFNARKKDIVDPYIEFFRGIDSYYESQNNHKVVELLRKCFYLKVAPNIKTSDLIKISKNDKASIMVSVVRSWGWSMREIKDLNTFNDWSVARYRQLGDEIHDYLMRTTVQLIRRSKASLINASAEQDVEMEVLRRRVEAVYVKKNNKIPSEKKVMKDEPAYNELYFSCDAQQWHVSETSPERGQASYIRSAPRIVSIAAWLVYNRRYSPSTAFHMIPNASDVTLSDVQSLMTQMRSLIPSANEGLLDRSFLIKPRFFKQIIIVGNMERPGTAAVVEEVDVLALSSWNELFCEKIATSELRSWMTERKSEQTNVSMWLPSEGNAKSLALSLIGFMA